MSERTVQRMKDFKLPKGVRWGNGGPIEATVDGQRIIVGILTHDNIGPRSRRSFAEVRVGLKAKHDDIRKAVEPALADLVEKARI